VIGKNYTGKNGAGKNYWGGKNGNKKNCVRYTYYTLDFNLEYCSKDINKHSKLLQKQIVIARVNIENNSLKGLL
jgi:hypothetical protein